MKLDLRRIQPAWFRLLVLILLGLPLFQYGIIVLLSGPPGSFQFFIGWLLYTTFVYLLIVSTVGLSEFLGWLAGVCVLAVVTIGTSAIFFGILDGVGVHLKTATGEPYTVELWSKDLLKKGFAINSTIPYLLLVINSFSTAEITRKVARWKGRGSQLMPHAVTVLRTVQHFSEVLPQLMPVWREEFPRFFRPRFDEDMEKSRVRRLYSLVEWFFEATWCWGAAILVYGMEPIPVYCHMIERHFEQPGDVNLDHDDKEKP